MKVEKVSSVGFYDDRMLLLTSYNPLREGTVESVFDNPSVEVFKEIEGIANVNPFTDVSLLHARCVLYYATTDKKLFSFNVDTRANTEIDVGNKAYTIGSLTGVNCGAKVVFQGGYNDGCTYTLNMDNEVTKVNEKQVGLLTVLFPSGTEPTNIRNGVFKYSDDTIIKGGSKIDTSHLVDFKGNCPAVRVYRDVFLAYNHNTKSWVLVQISTP